MKIDFSKQMKNLDGTISQDAPTLGTVAIRALVEELGQDDKATGQEKFDRALLAQRLVDAGEIEISVEEAQLIKARIGKAFAPLIVMGAWQIIEGEAA